MYQLKSLGMFKWKAYQQHRESIRNSVRIINQEIARLKGCRLQSGLFYLVQRGDGNYKLVFASTIPIISIIYSYNYKLGHAIPDPKKGLFEDDQFRGFMFQRWIILYLTR